MTRKEALENLLAKVEAGEWDDFDPLPIAFTDLCRAAFNRPDPCDEVLDWVADANDGSLDAAKALHEAALPGWDFQVYTTWETISHASVSAHNQGSFNGDLDPLGEERPDMSPARAWLIAILKALSAQEQTQ